MNLHFTVLGFVEFLVYYIIAKFLLIVAASKMHNGFFGKAIAVLN